MAFCQWLSKKEGKQYCLPTEAQWEYACRAGSTTRFFFGENLSQLADYAWYDNQGGIGTHPVGKKRPNAWGLYDINGNAWQWCTDFYDDKYYASSPVDDPSGPSNGDSHTGRGGSWHHFGGFCRPSYRAGAPQRSRGCDLGFRVCRVAD